MATTRRERRLHKRNKRAALAVAIGLVFASGVIALVRQDTDKAVVASSNTTTTVALSPAAAPPTTALPAGTSFIATAKVEEIGVYEAPGGTSPVRTFANPWFVNDDPNLPVPLVFGVQQRQNDGWIEVLLPTRPNESTGWVRAEDVSFSVTRYHITVELGAHRLQVFDGEQLLLESAVAVGAPATPTPTGKYYIVALLRAPNPNTVYGPYAYGLSGHSEVLETFAGGDAEVGIHGNNDESVFGQDVSHGCVRMSNDGITQLAGLLPLGTPVSITA